MKKPTQSRARRALSLALVLGGGLLAALLWSRLKLVTGIPRTAYAEPESARGPAGASDALGARETRLTSENANPSPIE